MPVKIDINRFLKSFSSKNHFTKNDLFRFYLETEPGLKDGTLRRRIDILKKRGTIHEVGHGIYSFVAKLEWAPIPDNSLKKVYSKVINNYNSINCSVWSTEWLNEFTNLQAFRHTIIIDVEKDASHSVFEFLTSSGIKKIYYRPGKTETELYLAGSPKTYIVNTLLSKAPLQSVKNVSVPRLEKILVDVFCDKDLFIAYQGSELINIFSEAFKRYSINITVLQNYSRRRGRLNEISVFIKKYVDIKLPSL